MDRIAARVVALRRSPVEEGAPFRVRVPLIGEDQVQVPVPVQVGHLHVPAVHGPEHLPPFGGIPVRRSPVDEGLVVRVHRDMVVQSAVGEDDVGVPVPVQVLHRHRPGAPGGKTGPAGGLGAALGAAVDEGIQVGPGAVEVVGHDQLGIAVPVQIGHGAVVSPVGGQPAMSTRRVSLISTPVDEQVRPLVGIVVVGDHDVDAPVVIQVQQLDQDDFSLNGDVGVDASVAEAPVGEVEEGG